MTDLPGMWEEADLTGGLTDAIPDPFAAPTVKPVEPTRVKPGSNGEWIWLDRSRYSAPDPVTGERRTWQRATNFIRALDDAFALARWSEARVAVGLALRPALLARVASLSLEDEDRDELCEVIERAKDAAGANDGADLGTAMHTWTQRMDAGESMPVLPDDVSADLRAYCDALPEAGLQVSPEYIERTMVNRTLGVMGTFDRLLRAPGGTCWTCELRGDDVLLVGDLKTGANELLYGQVKAAQQFALYANGTHLVNATRDGWEPAPRICPHVGVLIHLPVGQGVCTLHRVDLVDGTALIALSRSVHEARKTKNLVTPWEGS